MCNINFKYFNLTHKYFKKYRTHFDLKFLESIYTTLSIFDNIFI